MNLSVVREIVSDLVLMSQPRTVAVSAKVPSSDNLERERQSSRLIGSFCEIGRNMVCIARAIALVPLSLLFAKSGITVIPSSIYMSTFPLGSGYRFMSRSFPGANGDVSFDSASMGKEIVWGE